MGENWQIYEKIGSRWMTVLAPMSKGQAEAIVAGKAAELKLFEKAIEAVKKAGKKNCHPDPGFRDPHCVPV